MSNRILLDDEMVESVAGGNIRYVMNGEERYMWGSHAPDQKYTFASRKAMLAFVEANYDELGERGCIAEMVAQGIIVPINN